MTSLWSRILAYSPWNSELPDPTVPNLCYYGFADYDELDAAGKSHCIYRMAQQIGRTDHVGDLIDEVILAHRGPRRGWWSADQIAAVSQGRVSAKTVDELDLHHPGKQDKSVSYDDLLVISDIFDVSPDLWRDTDLARESVESVDAH